ncbi:uncharacterized protein LOC132032999 [Lycium ferocissimum]|uniref:uncharacterized protein LOC132032999 n=1 Tax=Lycium ferocissimum TaxID=112874 RepID=UPI0028164B1A|nr:uncharacterized protein LOC132032999 [Lycium ferocissimum]XP_059278816.1 uncharacterized protein LOC132032999 [Lycium ferocissimum]
MGKVTTITKTTRRETVSIATMEMKRKKKKGRPSLSDLSKRENNNNNKASVIRRSSRRNPNLDPNSNSPAPEFDDDEDERKQKKVKLVVRLPPNQSNQSQQHLDNSSEPDSEPELGDNNEKISTVDCRSDDVVSDQEEEKPLIVTDTPHESPLVSGPTTPLPDKKILVFILDRLQRKDTYGVFSEPVDPNELPDYHEIIEHPMDFGTLRKKLDGGLYSQLEELEADVYLICSNAMQYNAADTVYHRQARTIQDLARRDFENLRHAGEDGEPQPKVVRRGRPPGKSVKKSVENSPIDRVVPELSSGATLASGDDKAIGSNSYNLRKGPMLSKFHSPDASFAHRSRNGETYSEWSTDWNNEFPANILRADMKYGKKHFSIDENRRDTYQQFHPSASCSEPSPLWNTDGDMKRLMAVGVHAEQHAYARSLARFAANLGPVVWKVASKKLENILPAGVKFGPGWVGEGGGGPIGPSACSAEIHKSLDSSSTNPHSSRPVTPTPPGLNSTVMCKPAAEIFEAVKRLNSHNELTRQGSGDAAPQKSFLQPRNGFNGMFGYESSPQAELSRFSTSKGQSGQQEASRVNPSFHPAVLNDVASAENNKLLQSLATLYSGNSLPQGKNPDFCTEQNVSVQQRSRMSVPPDLNVRVQPPGSPSASLQIGSSQQPDLALQL